MHKGIEGLVTGSERSPEGGHGNSLQYSCLENPWAEGPGGIQFIEFHRVGQDWSDSVHTHAILLAGMETRMVYVWPHCNTLCDRKRICPYGAHMDNSHFFSIIPLSFTMALGLLCQALLRATARVSQMPEVWAGPGRQLHEIWNERSLEGEGFLEAQLVKNPPAMWSALWEDPLEKGMATHSVVWPGEFHGLCSNFHFISLRRERSRVLTAFLIHLCGSWTGRKRHLGTYSWIRICILSRSPRDSCCQ